MRICIATIMSFVCFLNSVGAEEQLKPIGYLRIEYGISTPLSRGVTTRVSNHLFNISDVPIRIQVGPLHYQPAFLSLHLPGKKVSLTKDYGVWGPPLGKRLMPKKGMIEVSGLAWSGTIPTWPTRKGIILFRNEGYSRKITFHPGWHDLKLVPAGTGCLVLNDSPSLTISSPLLTPDAVQPGKSILFGGSKKVYAPGARLIPYQARVNPSHVRRPVIGTCEESGVCLEVELPVSIKANEDVELIYLVGNCGKKTIWIDQSSLLQANLTCRMKLAKRTVTKIDGEDLKPLLSLYPHRTPIPLNPGEHLSYKRVIMASTAKLKRNLTYTCSIELEPHWYPTSLIKPNQQTGATLTSHVRFRTK